MGRTLPPFRPALDIEIASWGEFRRGLRLEDRSTFDTLLQFARQHADAGSLATRSLLSEVIFFSIALEHQKILEALAERLRKLESRLIDLEAHLHETTKSSSSPAC
jgi:hypothetical protein